jgi:hypothetical protein
VEAVQQAAYMDRRKVRAEFEKRFTAARMARAYVAAYRADDIVLELNVCHDFSFADDKGKPPPGPLASLTNMRARERCKRLPSSVPRGDLLLRE